PHELDPGVGEAVVGREAGDGVGGPGVAGVGVAHHDDGVAGRVGPDEPGQLGEVRRAGRLVPGVVAGVRVQVVDVDVDALGEPGPHEGETLGGQAVPGVELARR